MQKLVKDVQEQSMKRDMYHMIINGKAVESKRGETFATYNPASGKKIADIPKASREDVDDAVQAARQAFENGKWRRYSVAKRARVMNRIAPIMRSRLDELVEIEVLNS